MGQRRKPIEHLVRIPSEGSGPVFVDGVGNGYHEVRDAFMAMLRLIFPTIAVFEHNLPPVQRENSTRIPHVPNIGHFYPIGTMAPYVQMTPEQQAAINDLYLKIGEAIRKSYAEGNRNGQNLLVKLAKGEVALSDFDAGIAIVKPTEEE